MQRWQIPATSSFCSKIWALEFCIGGKDERANRHFGKLPVVYRATLLPLLLLAISTPFAAGLPGIQADGSPHGSTPVNAADDCELPVLDSPYIPVDSWLYPAVMRLYGLGFVDEAYLGMRPWTRASVLNMLEDVSSRIDDEDESPIGNEAARIYAALKWELRYDPQDLCVKHEKGLRVESIYSVTRAITGTPLRDSFHLGSTIVNDYGRPYENGLDNYSGASGYATAGRFSLYVRGEFQGAPSAAGYSAALSGNLATIDGTTDFFNPTCWLNGTSCTPIPYNQQATIPAGPIATTTLGRVMEAYVSADYLSHKISFGKQDDWLGPGLGGGMAYSNNAENIYSFRINRVEPLHIPLLSLLTGPFRYDFLVGPLKGHVYPDDPWVHVEKISFKPTPNLEFGFERTVIWGGKGHEPITLHTFLRSFFSLTAPPPAVKDSPRDPGARFGAFDFSYRLPFVRNWLTLYTDSEAHDEVSPIDAPRRACVRPGLYLSHFPGIAKLDMRIEGVSTNPPSPNNQGGKFEYFESIQRQGYTNRGQLFGDWIGREAKGAQGWITYHLSGNEWIEVGARNQKTAKDFIPGGTTLNDVNFQLVKRVGKDFEINGKIVVEHWKAPIYLPGPQTVTTTTIQVTWFPGRKIGF